MRFEIENYERHKNAGLEAHRAGKAQDARYHFLMAAKALFQAAGKSEGELKKSRIANANRLVEIARAIKTAPQPSKSRAEAVETVCPLPSASAMIPREMASRMSSTSWEEQS